MKIKIPYDHDPNNPLESMKLKLTTTDGRRDSSSLVSLDLGLVKNSSAISIRPRN